MRSLYQVFSFLACRWLLRRRLHHDMNV